MDQFLMMIFFALTVAEYVSFYYVIFGKRAQVTKKKAMGLLVAAALLAYGSLQGWSWGTGQGYAILVSLLILQCVFPVRIRENLLLGIAAIAILTFLEVTVHGILVVCFRLERPYDMFACLASVLAGLMLTEHILEKKKLDRRMFGLSFRMRAMVAAVEIMLCLLVTYFDFVLQEVLHGMAKDVGMVLVSAGSLTISALLFAIVYYFNSMQDYSMQAEAMEAQNEQQREYFEQLLKKEQDTRQFRHDLISQLLELQNYCQKEEYGKLEGFLEEMLGEIAEIGRRQYDVGNDIVNTIVNYYFIPIKESCKIKVRGYIAEEQRVSQRDLCVLVSNLVKNAAEAAGKRQGEILFEVSQGKRGTRIHVRNTMEGELKMQGGFPLTTKEDKRNHGMGVKTVVGIVEKYNGIYRFKPEDGWYDVEIYF